MKNIYLFTISLIFCCTLLSSQKKEPYRVLSQNNFGKGEHLEYLVHYGFLNAGIASVDVDNKLYLVNKRPCYRIDVYGKSTGSLEAVTKIRDFWRSYVDTASIQTQKFYRNLLEGDYTKEETTNFYPIEQTAQIKDERGQRNFNTPAYVQDLVSGFYFLRTINFEKYKKGDIISVPGVLETDTYDLKIEFLGEEEAKCLLGKTKCYVLSPFVPENKLFRGKRPVKVFISADKNRIPIRMQAEFVIGKVEVELKNYKNMKHNFSFE
ncbi:MAG: DUF3108 domain-containing protein [Thermonemataceae bacterium]|nr:DUF3108 domain-containing protein [Thermonemataceae bacterium]